MGLAVHALGPTQPSAQGDVDTDGDGIPDRHDFCPRHFGSSKGFRFGWLSGRATDFDGDGCEDGVEDQDRDNDGIWDAEDRCPNTPQSLSFVSNIDNDFDRDGCADDLEDDDNDDDGLHNVADTCPSTRPGDVSDATGCSKVQRSSDYQDRSRRMWQRRAPVQSSCSKPEEKPESWREWAIGLLAGHSLDVLLGAALSWLAQQGFSSLGRHAAPSC